MPIRLPLTQGQFAIIDEQDAPRVAKHKWFARKERIIWYAYTNVVIKGHRTVITLHRFLLDFPSGLTVDHINGNGLDCRRSNLRVCTNTENVRNMKRRKDNASGFKGVNLHKGRWRAYITIDGHQKSLGYYDSPADAARAYDSAALIHFGQFARTNF